MNKKAMLSILQHVITKEETVEYSLNLNTFVASVCGGCNHGWMSDLEGQVGSILEPIFLGQQAVGNLPDAEKAVLRRWAMKSALATFAAKGSRVGSPPQSHYRLLAEGEDLPIGVHCLSVTVGSPGKGRCAAFINPNPSLMEDQDGTILGEEDVRGSYCVTLQFGSVTLIVLFCPAPDHVVMLNRNIFFPVGQPVGEYAWYSQGDVPFATFERENEGLPYLASTVSIATSMPDRGTLFKFGEDTFEVVGPPFGVQYPAPPPI